MLNFSPPANATHKSQCVKFSIVSNQTKLHETRQRRIGHEIETQKPDLDDVTNGRAIQKLDLRMRKGRDKRMNKRTCVKRERERDRERDFLID